MDIFLSCDWGTSNFRLRLVQMQDLSVTATVQNNHGISTIFKSWQQQDGKVDRNSYYTNFLHQQIAEMQRQVNIPLEGIPVVLSGMASSSIGLMELPYKKLPFRTDGADLVVQHIHHNYNPLLIISGASTTDDVMRGEETKIVGATASINAEEHFIVLPGTHTKHIRIRSGQVISFQTFMTGEFFSLLSNNSILASSVADDGAFDRDSFISAVQKSRGISLLEHSFKVRTNQLLKGFSPQQNYHYLSGLLIGEELKTLSPELPLMLMGGSFHTQLYALACETLGIPITSMPDADDALIEGQQLILSARRHLFSA
ncbi:2-dehydro-3-deoxygalactonokinase [Chitinophaga sp. GCM10012297]|uniref:2-dehydro-3-deoxygalactonokinase n=1 Tax=Chitinophaga chungangae TaxID=2821488 RepID=A0ABS3YKX5_9BACT|nr:2-dehydro-3-deoxygalactonokinase [Chitinophaga chungangae]MBO9155360.1 2-dehydro-3-deoxygalactonokinase [Chitinophaga chungangae]